MPRLPKLKTMAALGVGNIARVAVYRLGLRMGVHPCLKISATVPEGPFFSDSKPKLVEGILARDDWVDGQGRYFGKPAKIAPATGAPPDWHTVPKGGARAVSDLPWWGIPDFSTDVGDIKQVWEMSRFDWVIAFSQRAALGGKQDLERLNLWLQDWVVRNPPYRGVNWKCGQEASIRVMHLMLAALILGQTNSATNGLRALVRLHLARIAPTMGYAIGQANNHGTSEAAALFIGGSFLGGADGISWAKTGRRWLENRAQVLIEPDGTFSQYSVNYHRVMLDSFSLAEVWRRRMNLPAFSDKCHKRLAAATGWLAQMVGESTGYAPNIGANDGAQLIVLTNCDYRDYRPSVQLASTLFRNQMVYADGPWDQQLLWLGVEKPRAQSDPLISTSFNQGGMHVLRAGAAVAYLRYPRFRFRPSQADALHCDLWVNSENILRDAGTYSYNMSAQDTAYFNGTVAHNTVEFDGRDQMPRLGRFLFGNWLKSDQVEQVLKLDDGVSAGAAYRDYLQAYHHRQLKLTDNHMIVTDSISGFHSAAVLRWRLAPGDWKLDGQNLHNGITTLKLSATMTIRRIALTEGFESRYYLKKTPLPVLEVEVDQPGTLTTEIRF